MTINKVTGFNLMCLLAILLANHFFPTIIDVLVFVALLFNAFAGNLSRFLQAASKNKPPS